DDRKQRETVLTLLHCAQIHGAPCRLAHSAGWQQRSGARQATAIQMQNSFVPIRIEAPALIPAAYETPSYHNAVFVEAWCLPPEVDPMTGIGEVAHFTWPKRIICFLSFFSFSLISLSRHLIISSHVPLKSCGCTAISSIDTT